MKMFYPEIRNPVLLKYIVETLLAVFGNREYLLNQTPPRSVSWPSSRYTEIYRAQLKVKTFFRCSDAKWQFLMSFLVRKSKVNLNSCPEVMGAGCIII